MFKKIKETKNKFTVLSIVYFKKFSAILAVMHLALFMVLYKMLILADNSKFVSVVAAIAITAFFYTAILEFFTYVDLGQLINGSLYGIHDKCAICLTDDSKHHFDIEIMGQDSKNIYNANIRLFSSGEEIGNATCFLKQTNKEKNSWSIMVTSEERLTIRMSVEQRRELWKDVLNSIEKVKSESKMIEGATA